MLKPVTAPIIIWQPGFGSPFPGQYAHPQRDASRGLLKPPPRAGLRPLQQRARRFRAETVTGLDTGMQEPRSQAGSRGNSWRSPVPAAACFGGQA